MRRDESGRLIAFGGFRQLETERLILRKMTLDDVSFWLRHFSDPDIVELTGFDGPQGTDGAKEELLRYCVRPFRENMGIRWGIALKGRHELIGTLGYHQWIKEGRYHSRIGHGL